VDAVRLRQSTCGEVVWDSGLRRCLDGVQWVVDQQADVV